MRESILWIVSLGRVGRANQAKTFLVLIQNIHESVRRDYYHLAVEITLYVAGDFLPVIILAYDEAVKGIHSTITSSLGTWVVPTTSIGEEDVSTTPTKTKGGSIASLPGRQIWQLSATVFWYLLEGIGAIPGDEDTFIGANHDNPALQEGTVTAYVANSSVGWLVGLGPATTAIVSAVDVAVFIPGKEGLATNQPPRARGREWLLQILSAAPGDAPVARLIEILPGRGARDTNRDVCHYVDDLVGGQGLNGGNALYGQHPSPGIALVHGVPEASQLIIINGNNPDLVLGYHVERYRVTRNRAP